MKALVDFKNQKSKLVVVNSSYSRGGIHYYNLTLNSLDTFLDFKAGETKLFNEFEIAKLTYIMS
jgi:hypothetical protein